MNYVPLKTQQASLTSPLTLVPRPRPATARYPRGESLPPARSCRVLARYPTVARRRRLRRLVWMFQSLDCWEGEIRKRAEERKAKNKERERGS